MKLAAFLFVGVALSGCASYYWTKPGLVEREFARDKYECLREARIVAYPSYPSGGTGFAGGFMQGYSLGLAMRARREADEIFSLCMQSRG